MYVGAYLSEGDNIGHEIITFPSKEKELNILCDSLGVVNTAKQRLKSVLSITMKDCQPCSPIKQ